ncbi:MAG: efflux RND transporter periplasmic adaptor subunit, partial [Lachnospiraceae bacterium]|nr:efflux RND transporter periplasmic adaptor subunit [Lachnospiraceae bacterium]
MMEKDEEKLMSRKRLEKWIKIFLLFLAFVWLCTIISKSIYVSGLPVVTTDTPSKKYVEHIVEADGIVTTGGEIAVNTQAGLRIDRLYVMQGDEVKAGDVLFTIDTNDIADIIRTKETELAKMQCNLSEIQVNAVIEAQKKEIEILWAQEDYETADQETSIAKERAKEALDKAEAELATHLADTVPYTSDSARRDAWNDY